MSTSRRQPPESWRAGWRGPVGAAPRARARRATAAARHPSAEPGEPRGEEEVLLDGQQPVHAGLLEQQPQAAADRRLVGDDVVAEDARRAARGREQGGQQQHRRGLAGAVGAEQADQAGPRHDEVERVERPDLAVVAAEPLGLDRRAVVAHTCWGSAVRIR